VIGVVNYVIAARPSLLNFVIADSCCQGDGLGSALFQAPDRALQR